MCFFLVTIFQLKTFHFISFKKESCIKSDVNKSDHLIQKIKKPVYGPILLNGLLNSGREENIKIYFNGLKFQICKR